MHEVNPGTMIAPTTIGLIQIGTWIGIHRGSTDMFRRGNFIHARGLPICMPGLHVYTRGLHIYMRGLPEKANMLADVFLPILVLKRPDSTKLVEILSLPISSNLNMMLT